MPIGRSIPRDNKPPELQQGDNLTRAEFERRYEAMPEVKKAELVEGIVFVGGRVTWRHGERSLSLAALLGYYSGHTPGTMGAINASIRLDAENEFQPDVTLLVEPDHGGRVRMESYVEGSPDLVAEVCESSVSIDLNQKFRVYQRNQVREYIVYRLQDDALDWFVFRNTRFEHLEPDANGILKSEAFPGLWLNAPAMLRDEKLTVIETLKLGLASPEHAAFVVRLAAG